MLATIDDVTTIYVDPNRRRDFINQINYDGALRDFESQVYRQDGQVIWISESARMVYDSSDKFLYYEGTVRDITRYKHSQDPS
ncbi:MAG: PAS domain S-box protein [Merismopedia sp. SIO2A8]|nr:PAS domain S-box protein [Merismopedia sp. SIO2A8]